ncbi:molybdopterin molybdotransferase MoeA [Acinetobacter larvae]|uniref:Molybdopterin molybdenumtransferase n=1 Tax=Acinetobacter larvae TaxID=1789224 RepID=A0A1B2M083_9GAMM|nr:molybdopterin molybdotransferase MoeA [Acinetobacter larvae]AOA58579.1 molybdopterin molybdenumtransferase MoeA [Acinetobacter larvae]
MTQQDMISIDQAFEFYEQYSVSSIYTCPLSEAHRHYLAQDVISQIALPLFDQSAVDGYALSSQDILDGIRQFELLGEIRAGVRNSVAVTTGQCLRIFTGGLLAAGTDSVARQEIVSLAHGKIQLHQTIEKGCDVRYQGEELGVGTVLARRGQWLNSGLIAALSMAGVTQLSVYRRPRIAVLITGDEVATTYDPAQYSRVGDPPKTSIDREDHHVYDANAPMILTWLQAQGYAGIYLEHVADNHEAVQRALSNALNHYDVVISTGGVSVGDYDLIRPVSKTLGAEEIFWKVAQKPGKPMYFARYQHAGRHCYLLGLPGNPAAVWVALWVHVATLLNALQGCPSARPRWQMAKLKTGNILKMDSREQLLRMRLDVDAHGQGIVSTLHKQQSHMLSNLATANVIARIPIFNDPQQAPDYIACIPTVAEPLL